MDFIRQLVKAGAQSGSVMFVGDAIYQTVSTITQGNIEALSLASAARMALVGATLHGPYFFVTFSAVDSLFGPSRTFSTVLKKTALIQLTVFPFYLYALFAYLGILEGKRWPEEVVANSLVKTPSAFAAGCVFWPIVNVLGFRFIRPQHRVLYLASTGVSWNAFISHANRVSEGEKI